MEDQTIHMDMTVKEVLNCWPQTITVFLRHQMNCVGCSMLAFDTLRDCVKVYGLTPDLFLDELRQVVSAA
ncbi:MAG: DUF1858 domain-containing protein [Anaerolineaceae bacterium]|nr:DUF1858 domain-containing protein [Anaerolineaceae bacterium]